MKVVETIKAEEIAGRIHFAKHTFKLTASGDMEHFEGLTLRAVVPHSEIPNYSKTHPECLPLIGKEPILQKRGAGGKFTKRSTR